MIGILRAAVVALLMALAAPCSLGAAASPPSTASGTTYVYDRNHHAAAPTHTRAERGPPAAYGPALAYNVDDHWSRDALARTKGATTPAITTYTHPGTLARLARATTTAAQRVVLVDGVISSVERSDVAAKSVDEAGALVRYDAMAASRNLLGQVGEGYARTPSGYTVSAHAAERIVYGAPGRSPTTLSRVDDILNNPTRTMMRDNGTIRVYQGKNWVAVRDSGPIHIVTVMVR